MKKQSEKQWPPIIKETRADGTHSWRVDTRHTHSRITRGRRLWFDSEAEAKEVARQARITRANEGNRAFSLTREELGDFERATWFLKPHGVSIAEAAEFYARHLDKQASLHSRTVSAVVDEFVSNPVQRANGGSSASYNMDLKYRLKRFEKTFGEREIGDITTLELADWLGGLIVTHKGHASLGKPVSAQTRTNFRRVLGVLFNFARARGYVADNPVTRTPRPGKSESEVGILTPHEAKKLLSKAGDEIRAYIAIGLFAGLRRSELEALNWREVDLENGYITVTAKNAKSARRRVVKVSSNLKAWLCPLAKDTGKVAPRGERMRNRFEAARKAAGFGTDKWLTAGELEAGMTLKPWPKNCLRHSFASYHLTQHENVAALALEMGHTNAQMIFQHYRQLVKPAEAERYWNIFPISYHHKMMPLDQHT